MTLLAFETSCDETSAAVVRHGNILSSVVSSQIELHADYGGVVPELAAREHLRHLLPVTRAALHEAGVTTQELDAIAATQGPGLPTALMIGCKAAQGLAFTLRKPFLGLNHHEAHLYSPWIRSAEHRLGSMSRTSDTGRDGARGSALIADFSAFQPNVSLIVSGGHTMLVHVAAELEHKVLGATIDDAAGECFDKTGKMLSLPYPAGPVIDRLAAEGDPKAFDFPRPLLNDANDDFSFSGLKTSVRYFLRDHPGLADDPQKLRDLCASVQAAIVEVLVTKTIRAARRLRVRCVTASGGVTCNRALRQELLARCQKHGLTLRLAEPSLCTDNAAMIGILAERKAARGAGSSLDAEIEPAAALG